MSFKRCFSTRFYRIRLKATSPKEIDEKIMRKLLLNAAGWRHLGKHRNLSMKTQLECVFDHFMDVEPFINNVEKNIYLKNLAVFTLQEFPSMFGHFSTL